MPADTPAPHRCHWCVGDAVYEAYHDSEWGFPVRGDNALFERLCLESFQSGLSWRVILNKRDGFRAAFAGFDIARVAAFTGGDVARLLADAGIVRHRGKIEAAINNARRAQEMVAAHGSLAAYFWRFSPSARAAGATPSAKAESTALSKSLLKLGWKFVGPTTIYAFMQAVGMVNDHDPACFVFEKAEASRLGAA
ncbi:MAG: DNA-3-methyladenine glycosylase I [Cypionkella sp.]|nr:DNA-3-methyladenine glycosylase I [Cypionkella sp.]